MSDMDQPPSDELPMPSDVRAKDAPGAGASAELIEPPSVKLVVRLFVIPLIIVACAVGIMIVVSWLAGADPTWEESLARLRNAGGERTSTYLIGPASKQRYLDAKTLVDKMKAPEGLDAAQRIQMAAQLIDILDKYTRPDEGEVQHFVLLALGRTWQKHPSQSEMNSAEAVESRKRVAETLLKYADSPALPTRKAAVLAMVYLGGHAEQEMLAPKLISLLKNQQVDIDVRIAAATVLGPLATTAADSQTIIAALRSALGTTDPHESELVWSASLSLAQLNQPDVGDTILKLLDRNELSKMEYFDRESDPKNPTFRKLSDQEQQRILINTMLGAKNLQVPAVQEKLQELTRNDPSSRVRAAGLEIFGQK
jgi:hypothetical protein